MGSGRAKGWITSSCAGARVAGRDGELGLSYLPAHTVNGKLFNQRVTFTVYINSTGGVKPDGTPGRSDQFQFVAYGPLADSICRSMSNGKALDAVLKPNSYLGRSFDANRVMRLEADGSPIMVRKVGFQIVESPTYGEDSQKTIDLEVASGRRPVNWNIQNHPDAATWAQMLKDRANIQYVPGSTTFCYARVLPLIGAGVVQVAQAPTGPAAKAARLSARATNVVQPVTGYVPPVTGLATETQPVPPVALSSAQITALIAQITGTQAQTTGAEVTPPVATDIIDPKTGFPIATNNAGGAAQQQAF